MNQIINHEALAEATNCKKLDDLEKTLRENKIPFFYGKGGRVWTTLTALNNALGLYKDQKTDEGIEFK
jgi:hypothetical protein